ncbi:NTP transferase domain-containing protein [Candidatus Methylomirabilis sp.]|uniref:phosphocholine cytidylyltransferase family protein n=1 Tax=Candidatus Methylomirabilis sp. TaxID=2032687 RepID=UPI0030768118
MRQTQHDREIIRPGLHIIVLAAGTGSRLRPHTDNLPKAMIPLPDGQSLLGHTLSLLSKDPLVGDIVIVGGYEYEVLRRYVETQWNSRCRTIFNPDYARKGPVYSVLRGLEQCHTERFVAIMNGDTWFSKSALRLVTGMAADAVGATLLFGLRATELAADDIRILADEGRIRRVGKGIDRAQMISAGCCLLPPRAVRRLHAFLASIEAGRHPEVETWHEALNHLLEAGEPIEFRSLPRDEWQEIDDESDLAKLIHRMDACRKAGAM